MNIYFLAINQEITEISEKFKNLTDGKKSVF